MIERSARDIVEEMFRRQQAGDDNVIDGFLAEDMVNHAAGQQGRSGLRHILATIDNDFGPVTVEQLHLIGEGDLVANTSHCAAPIEHPPCRYSQALPLQPVQWHGPSPTYGGSQAT